MNILIVEDHFATAQSLQLVLSSQYQVTHASSCEEAFTCLEKNCFDIVIVDLNLPDTSGLELCHYFHNEPDAARVLVLSGKSDIQTKATALYAGADDFVCKPFQPQELQARVRALLRRSRQKLCPEYSFGKMKISLTNQAIYTDEKRTSLTPTETQLLEVLLHRHGQVIPRIELSEMIGKGEKSRATLDTYIKSLRQKLSISRKSGFLETIYGVGYRFTLKYA